MKLGLQFALGVDWLVAVAWLLRVVTWRLKLPSVPDLLRTDYRNYGTPDARVSVIVPARNEAPNVAATLASLLGSQRVALDVIAVNDRSTDATGAAMDSVAQRFAADGRLRVLHVTELPDGWLGKTHAMAIAAAQATGEWLLFTDADVLFRPDALERAVAFATYSGADHLVLLPTILLQSWGERMMISFLQVLSLWAVRPWRVPDPRAKRDAIGVGAFNLIRREVYEKLGGWEALRTEVLEDLALGKRIKALGFAQRIALGLDLVSVRWAHGAFGVVDNLTKNLFALFRFRPLFVFGFAFCLAIFSLLPLLGCLAGPVYFWPAGLALLALFLGYRWTGRYHHFSSAQMLLYPVASVLLIYALLRSMTVALWRGGVTWRGTFYGLATLRRRSG